MISIGTPTYLIIATDLKSKNSSTSNAYTAQLAIIKNKL